MAVANAANTMPRNPQQSKTHSEDGIPLDQWKRPRIRPYPGAPMPGARGGWRRASTLGEFLEDQNGIGFWRQRQAIYGAALMDATELAAIRAIDPTEQEGKTALGQFVDRAHELADTDAAAKAGTAFHAVAERIDLTGEIPTGLHPRERPMAIAYRRLMQPRFRVLWTERRVVCDEFEVTGRPDKAVELLCPLTMPDGTVLPVGTVLIVDVKTSGTDAYFGVKFEVQTWIYVHGHLYDHDGDEARGIKPGTRTPHGAHPDWALIIHVPYGGTIASLHAVDLRTAQDVIDLALKVSDARKRKAVKPLRIVETVTPEALAELDAREVQYAGVDDGVRTTAEVETGEQPAHAARIAATVQGAHERRQAAERAAQNGPVWAELLACTTAAEARAVWKRHSAEWRPEHTEWVRDQLQ